MSSTTSSTKDISFLQLEQAFAAFNQVSADLGTSYKELESKVSNLSIELAATKSARIEELTAKEILAGKLSALMDALPGGIIVINSEGIIKEENLGAKSILGKSYYSEKWSQVISKLSNSDEIYDGEVSFKSGKRISITSSAYGESADVVILLTDVSENYRLNDLINREQRLAALGEMAARLAHQVRTPLSTAILYLSHLSSSELTEKILSKLKQIEKMIDGMLSYIRGETNSADAFSLNELLISLKESSLPAINDAQGSLTINLPKYDCIMNGSHEALTNALSNLIDNAIQAVKTNPIITISLEKEDTQYYLSIKDNGPGIPADIQEQIFEPFFSTRQMGTGLGLAVVMSVIKAHKGEITIQQKVNKSGTIFNLSLPQDSHNTNQYAGIWEKAHTQFNKQINNTTQPELTHG